MESKSLEYGHILLQIKGFLRRVIGYISFAVFSFIFGIFIKTDIIIATALNFLPPYLSMLSLFKQKPWVMEVRDLADSIVAVGSMKKNS